MIFDKPQWTIRPVADEVTICGIVRNVVQVLGDNGEDFEARILVPTDFFNLLRGLIQPRNVFEVVVGVGQPKFYLEQVGSEWVFGFCLGEEPYDLWTYPTLPPWAVEAR
jgi:hypothetical protein